MKKRPYTLLKVVVTLFGLVYVLDQVPLTAIQAELAHVAWAWLLVSFLLMNLSLVLRAYRWLALLRGLNAPISFGRLVALYFIGNFFNAFLPSGFGGDAVRVVEIAQDVPAVTAAGTVILDRLTGLLMLFIMVLFALPFRPAAFPTALLHGVVLLCVVGLVGGGILLDGRLLRRLGAWLPRPISPAGDGPVAKVLQAIQGCGWRAIGAALAVSFLFNLLLVSWWLTTGLALGLQVSFGYYLLVVPIISVAYLVPSIGGLGVNETIAPLLFAGAGVAEASAVSLSFLVFLVMRASGLLGAPVYLLALLRRQPRPLES